MKIYKSNNKYCHFSELNQGDEDWSKYACTLFAPAVNLKYNCNITLTEGDLMRIAKQQNELGLFNYTKGGKGYDGAKAIFKAVCNFHRVTLIEFNKDDDEYWYLINKGYSIIGGMGVNKEFLVDAKDGKIETYEDYKNYKGNIYKHFTNYKKWIKEGNDYGKESILDSYAYNKKGKEWICYIDLEELRENILYPTMYAFV